MTLWTPGTQEVESIHVSTETRRQAEAEGHKELERLGFNPPEWVITAYDTGTGPWLVMFRKRTLG